MKFILISLLLISPLFVYAQTPGTQTPVAGSPAPVAGSPAPTAGAPVTAGNTGGGTLTNPLNANDLPTLLQEVLQYVVKIGTIFLTLMIIYTGFKFIEARGNEEKISSARTSLVWTVIGGLLLLGASAIAAAISATVQSL